MFDRIRLLAVIALVVALVTPGAATAAPAPRTTTTVTTATIVNFDQGAPRPAGQPYGAQVVKLDSGGNHLDTSSDFIAYLDGSYYLYGESSGCGFRFQFGEFCGFHVYQSPDLVHWTFRGKVLDPATSEFARVSCRRDAATSCWGPMVVQNPRTGRYVLWFYIWSPPADGRLVYVAEGDSPAGPFGTPRPATGIPAGDGFAPDIFVDRDGSAYLSSGRLQPTYPGCPIPSGCPFGLVVQKLNDTHTGGTGPVTTVTRPPASPQLESPSIIRDGDRYFLLTNPICAYCATPTTYVVADHPLGPWRDRNGNPSQDATFDPYPLSTDSCGGQPFHVAHLPTWRGEELNLYVSMQWYGSANEGAANHYWAPLRIRSGQIEPLRCAARETVPLARPVRVGTPPPLARNLCVAGSGNAATQTLTAPVSGRLSSVELPLYQKQRPASLAPEGMVTEPLTVTVGNTRSGEHGAVTLAPDAVSWSPTRVRLDLPVSVRRGDRLTLSLSSATPQGCYESLYTVHDPYRAGRLTGTGDVEPLTTPGSDLLVTARIETRAGVTAFGAA
jgi:Glycosyl hydrolases family 43